MKYMKIFKSIICVILAVTVIAVSVQSAFSADGNSRFVTSDREAVLGDVFFFVDEKSGLCYSALTEGGERTYYTDFPVSQTAVYDGMLYYSNDYSVFCADPETHEYETAFTANEKITRFAVCDGSFYVLSGGRILTSPLKGGETHYVIPDRHIRDIWFDRAGEISYMPDENTICTLNLSDGEYSSRPNFISEYEGNIPVYTRTSGKGADSPDSLTLTSLQAKFPAGKYWNHVGMSSNNQDGYTSKPCPSHATTATCNCFTPHSSWQCFGYAYKCGYDTSGSNPGGWTQKTSSSSVDSVKAGDIIRYRNNGHSIFVIGVNGNTVTFTDCNWDNHCGIRWYATVSKSTLKSSFTSLRVNPANVVPGSGDTTDGKLKVSFDANGGTVAKSSAEYDKNDKIGTLPMPQRTGYTFEGWYTSASAGSKVTESTRVTSDMTVYARWKIIVYTIKFDGNGNGDSVTRIPDTQKKEYGETINLNLKTPSRNGYQFKGWTADINGSGTVYSNSNREFSENRDVTLYAQWAGIESTVTFDANGGTVSEKTKRVTYGSQYGALPVPKRNGYSFQGWFTKNSGGEQITETTTVSTTNVSTLYAHWDSTKCTVTYDANGGSGAPQAQTKNNGINLKLSTDTPTKSGASFIEWNTQSDGSGDSYKPGDYYTGDDSVILYAMWSGVRYTVTYNANGGSGGPTTQTKTRDVALTITSETPKLSGLAFVSWNTSADGSGTSYLPGGKYTGNADLTLYAQWDKTAYTVTYNMNGGSGSIQSQIKEPDVTLKLSEVTPTYDNHDFECWNTSPDGSGDDYKPGQDYTGNDSLTLYAQWKAAEYTVTYFANGGINAPAKGTKSYNVPYTLPAQIPTRAGYSFRRWNTAANGSGNSYAPGDVLTGNADMSLYAQWNPNSFRVTFDADGGTASRESAIFRYNDVYGELPTAEKAGFTFDGWRSPDGSIVSEDDLVRISSNTVFKAVWSPEKFTLTFDAAPGECEIKSKDIYFSEKIGELPVPVREGYIFAGWFDRSEDNVEINAGTKVTALSDITVYASWIARGGTLVFNPEGGKCDIISKTLSYGDEYGDLPVPERNGFIFDGWYSENGKVTASTVYDSEDTVELYAGWTADESKVTLDGTGSIIATYGDKLGELPVPVTDGVFCGWFDENGKQYTKDTVCDFTSDKVLYPVTAQAPETPMTAKFVADGKTVAEVGITDEYTVAEPAVPEKEGYEGKWSDYDLTGGSCVILAEYTPLTYTLKCGEAEKHTAFGEPVDVTGFDIPAGCVVSGFEPELPLTMPAENLSVNPVFTPVKYSAQFISEGVCVEQVDYTVESGIADEPQVPGKDGYKGEWEDYKTVPGGIAVFSRFTPVDYTVTFVADGKEVAKLPFNAETEYFEEPAVPVKRGYEGRWADYDFSAGNKTVEAVYTPVTYTATFYADGVKVGEVEFTSGDKTLAEPAVPAKDGYTGKWPEYIIGPADFILNAQYTPVTYYAKFVANGTVVAELPFTVENMTVTPPAVPNKSGVRGEWEPYTLRTENITVNAVYKTVSVSINRYEKSISVRYRTTVNFSATVSEDLTGGGIHWYIDGRDASGGKPSAKFSVENAEETFTVQAVYVVGNDPVAFSEVETVNVDRGIFARILAFFRMLFRRSSEYTQ